MQLAETQLVGKETVKTPNEIVKTKKATRPWPPKPVRDELRRDQIANAARHCVLRHGFHAASMAQIAQQAQMSVGQIYRYFENKEAIIHDIVERIMSQRLAWIASTGGHADLAGVLVSRMFSEDPDEADDRALLLEVTAEATRNPQVAAIVKKSSRKLQELAVATVRQDHPEFSEAEAATRVEFVTALGDGITFRRVGGEVADPAALASLCCEIIRQLLPGIGQRASASTRKPGRK